MGAWEHARVPTLADLENWAHDTTAPKVYSLNEHLRGGKTSTAERLGVLQMFWCQILLLPLKAAEISDAVLIGRLDTTYRSGLMDYA